MQRYFCEFPCQGQHQTGVSGSGQASYIILLTCEEGGHDMRSCSDLGPAQAASCHTRCCQPWQIYHHHSNACVYTKSKYLERYG